jgi:ABC-type sulfate/molybdate transport systems ATPase subunit
VVLATHDMELAAALADRIVEVKEGAAREVAPPGPVFESRYASLASAACSRQCLPGAITEAVASQ